MAKTGISVVVVSWNTKDITDHCLHSLKESVNFVKNRADVEVLVVENDSEDGTPEMIEKKHPWVKLFKSGSDLGYAKGNNYGFARINPNNPYVLLINNDAFVQKDTLAKSLDYLEKHPECDVLGCGLRYEDGRFQPSAGFLPTPRSVWGWLWGLDKLPVIKKYFDPVHPKDPAFFADTREVGWVMGAFLFMKREVFAKTNGFDENFFMYMEEVEWCRRVHQLGYKIWYVPEFTITHVDKASAFGLPAELAKIFYKEIMGLMYYLKKHFPAEVGWATWAARGGIFFRLITFGLLGNSMRRGAYLKILKNL